MVNPKVDGKLPKILVARVFPSPKVDGLISLLKYCVINFPYKAVAMVRSVLARAKLQSTRGTSYHNTAQKSSFPLAISSVNVTKSTGNCVFGHIYWRNP